MTTTNKKTNSTSILPSHIVSFVVSKLFLITNYIDQYKSITTNPIQYNNINHRNGNDKQSNTLDGLLYCVEQLRQKLSSHTTIEQILDPLCDCITSLEINIDITYNILLVLIECIQYNVLQYSNNIDLTLLLLCRTLSNCSYHDNHSQLKDEQIIYTIVQLHSTIIYHILHPSNTNQQTYTSTAHHTSPGITQSIWCMFQTLWHIIDRSRTIQQYSHILELHTLNVLHELIRVVCYRAYHDELQYIIEFICALCSTAHCSTYVIDTSSISNTVIESAHDTPNLYFSPFSYFKTINKKHSIQLSQYIDLNLLSLPSLNDIIQHSTDTVHTYTQLTEYVNRCVMVCNIIQTLISSASIDILTQQPLLHYIQYDICKFILRISCIPHSSIVTHALQLQYQLTTLMRHKLAVQIEIYFNTVYVRILSNNNAIQRNSNNQLLYNTLIVDPTLSLYQLHTILLQSLYTYCTLPWFYTELYINYDLNYSSSALYKSVYSTLCRCALSVNGISTNNHVLAIQCLQQQLIHIRDRNKHNTSTTHEHHNLFNDIVCELNQWKSDIQPIVQLFNDKPRKSLQTMSEKYCIYTELYTYHNMKQSDELSAVAIQQMSQLTHLLKYYTRFDRISLGQLIAEPNSFYYHLRHYYVTQFHFTDLSLDDAIRVYLESFRLPLEAQQIDRVLQEFSAIYYTHNQYNTTLSADCIHILCFSILMLNTDQHNVQVKNKMTLQQFVNNNRGINNNNDVPRYILEQLYYSIRNNEIKMSGDTNNGVINDALYYDTVMSSESSRAIQYIYADAQNNMNSIIHQLQQQYNNLPHPIVSDATANKQSKLLSDGEYIPTHGTINVDNHLFSSMWTPLVAALTVMYECINNVNSNNDNIIYYSPASSPIRSQSQSNVPELDDRAINEQAFSGHTNGLMNGRSPQHNTSDTMSISDTRTSDIPSFDSIVHNLLTSCFTLLADISSQLHIGSTLDRIINALTRFTMLTNELQYNHNTAIHQQYISNIILQYSESYKCMSSTRQIFGILHSYEYDILCWGDIIQLLCGMLQLDIISPRKLIELCDYTPQQSHSHILLHNKLSNEQNTSKSLHRTTSSWLSYFTRTSSPTDRDSADTPDPPIDDTARQQYKLAKRRAMKCIDQCNIYKLLTKQSLSLQSCINLIQSLISYNSLQLVNHHNNVNKLLFTIQLQCIVVCSHSQYTITLWPMVYKYLLSLLPPSHAAPTTLLTPDKHRTDTSSNSTDNVISLQNALHELHLNHTLQHSTTQDTLPNVIYESSLATIAYCCIQYIDHNEIRNDLFTMLSELITIDLNEYNLVAQVLHIVIYIIRHHVQHITDVKHWIVIILLLNTLSQYQSAFTPCIQSLHTLIQYNIAQCTLVHVTTYRLVCEVILSFIKSSHNTIHTIQQCCDMLNMMQPHCVILLHNTPTYTLDQQWRYTLRPLYISYWLTYKLLTQHTQHSHDNHTITQYITTQYNVLDQLYKLITSNKSMSHTSQLSYNTLLTICIPLVDDTYTQLISHTTAHTVQCHELSVKLCVYVFKQSMSILVLSNNDITSVWLRILKQLHCTVEYCVGMNDTQMNKLIDSMRSFIHDILIEYCIILRDSHCIDTHTPHGHQLSELTFHAIELHYSDIKQYVFGNTNNNNPNYMK